MRRDLYNFRNRSYWLRRLENHGRRERAAVEDYTIEHILPQNENLGDEWKDDIGPAWSWVRDTYLHTLGNLTLTAYNSSLSDRPWREKRDGPNGLRFSPLRLNEGLGAVAVWDADAIKSRATRLAARAAEAWKAPAEIDDPDVLVQQGSDQPGGGSLVSVPYPMKALFEDIRGRIMALNPAVEEQFTPLVIRYATESVFASIGPTQRALKIVLNLPFPELEDANGLARDVSQVGHHGRGEVQVIVAPGDNLDQVMGLVRQAYEWRMDVAA